MQMGRFILKLEKETYFRLYNTGHEKFVMGLRNNGQAACYNHDLTLDFLQKYSNLTPLNDIITINIQWLFFLFLSTPAQYAIFKIHSCLAHRNTAEIFSKPVRHFSGNIFLYSLPTSWTWIVKENFVKLSTDVNQQCQKKARKQAHSSQILSVTCVLLHQHKPSLVPYQGWQQQTCQGDETTFPINFRV